MRVNARRMSFWKTTTDDEDIELSSQLRMLSSLTRRRTWRRVDQEDDTQAGAHLDGARAAHQQQRAVEDVGDDEDVEQIAQTWVRGRAEKR